MMCHRRGVTLMGMLMLLGILALLLALLLPAVQRVREAANRMTCGNNLKQLVIAAHNFHGDFNKLPPGYLGPVPDNAFKLDVQHIGIITMLLPYVEQDNIYKQLKIDFGLANKEEPWWKNNANWTLAQTHLPIFRCPSVPVAPPQVGALVAAHALNDKKNGDVHRFTFANPAGAVLGATNYAGNCGAAGKGDHEKCAEFVGPLTNRSDLTLGQMTVMDGTSNTLLMGEMRGEVKTNVVEYANSWMGVGALPTGWGLPVGDAAWYQFSSSHSQVVQFGFGDGSVRGIRRGQTSTVYSNDWYLLQQLAGYKDGRIADVSPLVD
jgi:hypothetical protein